MKIQQQLVNSSNVWNSSQWWKFIQQIASIWLYLNNSDLLCFALNSYFLTFTGGGGWLGWGKSRLKTISALLKLKLGLSLAKTKPIFAMEIDSNIYTILEKIISMSWKEKLTHQNQRILIWRGGAWLILRPVSILFYMWQIVYAI